MNRLDFFRLLPQVCMGILVFSWASSGYSSDSQKKQTVVSIHNGQWYLNGSLPYANTPAEGLLMNVRMVNATFEDPSNASFHPQENTDRFIQSIPSYVEQGIRAFTFNLQGGMPGYEKAINSAFRSDGTLHPHSMKRIQAVIEACDRNGCVAILGCFYQRQDQILGDEVAVKNAVVHTVQWIEEHGCKNVVLEIANEYAHGGYDHPILQTPQGEVELIRLAKRTAPGLLVSTSGVGDGTIAEEIAQEVDFILIHFNDTLIEKIHERIQSLKKYGKPIVCNEDDKTGEEAARAAQTCVVNGASWGYMNKEVNQYLPFEFNGPSDDPTMYAKLRELSQAKKDGESAK